jgi:glycosyltransferase involved in cell wall biosynthesis
MGERLITVMKEYEYVGVVAIGRNEGDRLKKCLESVSGYVKKIVYVDSGSTDNSLSIARELGVEIVELDITIPFTAARARNAGFKKLTELEAELKYVQFVDGECEIVEDWVTRAVSYLNQEPDVAVTCGRRKERYPEHSIYNMMCDIEWDTPIGEAKACGGDALYRIKAFNEAGGFREDLIAGEEPELCVRIRQNSWRIWRLDALMTLHDAAMTHFAQWWKRSVRGGYAYAEGAYLHGKPPEKHWVKETKRIWVWGGFIPLLIILLFFVEPWCLLLFSIYPLQVLRLSRNGNQPSYRNNWVFALFLVLGKFPELFGQFKFLLNLSRGKRGVLIEYK